MSLFSMSWVVLKSLFKVPATVRYPFAQKHYYENTRGKIMFEVNTCIFCGLCQRKCPAGAIMVERKDKKWELDRFKCIICGACVEACPKKCIHMEHTHTKPAVTKEKEKHIHA
ncbi:MAG: 4Fe-4S dicluster domain-containing protein [Candidatus Omnitrophica bacterium]|nr:4Fe-4S dicluster domain-containing protein [Candidatus Omnitrophota bacterium]